MSASENAFGPPGLPPEEVAMDPSFHAPFPVWTIERVRAGDVSHCYEFLSEFLDGLRSLSTHFAQEDLIKALDALVEAACEP